MRIARLTPRLTTAPLDTTQRCGRQAHTGTATRVPSRRMLSHRSLLCWDPWTLQAEHSPPFLASANFGRWEERRDAVYRTGTIATHKIAPPKSQQNDHPITESPAVPGHDGRCPAHHHPCLLRVGERRRTRQSGAAVSDFPRIPHPHLSHTPHRSSTKEKRRVWEPKR
jgi:hypothetical protein